MFEVFAPFAAQGGDIIIRIRDTGKQAVTDINLSAIEGIILFEAADNNYELNDFLRFRYSIVNQLQNKEIWRRVGEQLILTEKGEAVMNYARMTREKLRLYVV